MTKPVRWSPRSKRDIQEIKAFFNERNGNSKYSKKLLLIFRNSAEIIRQHIFIGKQTDIQGVRAFIILDYLILYEIIDEAPLILTVFDCRQNPDQLRIF